MKVFKPQRLSLVHRVLEQHRRRALIVSVYAWVPMDAPRDLLPEAALWTAVGQHTESGILDEGVPKPRGEVLLDARAFSVNGPAGAVMTRLRFGEHIDKQLAVIGDRHWEGDEATDPLPFEEMPIEWSRAFGGPGFERNPIGKGIVAIETDDGEKIPLPNVESRDELVAMRRDRPEPVGYGAYDVMWPQRFDKVGTYDEAWQEKLFPGPAVDFDQDYYLCAPPDQHAPDFFAGDESWSVEGMTPDAARVEGQLAPMVAKAFVTQREGEAGDTAFHPIEMRLDTVRMFPHLNRMALVFRGNHPVAEDDAEDIVDLMIAAEDPREPRDIEHYAWVRAQRYDKDAQALASIRDSDLLPPESLGWSVKIDLAGMDELLDFDNPALERAEKIRKKNMADTRAALEAKGMDTSAFDEAEAEIEPVPDPYDFDAVAAYLEKMDARTANLATDLEAQHEARIAEARESFAKMGIDYDEATLAAQQSAAAPPDFSAEEHMIMLHEMSRKTHMAGAPQDELDIDLTDPRYEVAMRDVEELAREGYRMSAHYLGKTAPIDDARRNLVRVWLDAARESGESLARRDLTGADLSGVDLSGVDLREAHLAHSDLTGCNLSDANLENAVLAGARMVKTNLSRANLRGANLGAALCHRTVFAGADLSGTNFSRSRIDGATFVGARLDETEFLETEFTATDLSHVAATKLVFHDLDLSGVDFTGATCTYTVFYEANVAGTDFTGADLTHSQFLSTKGEGACFAGATLHNVVITHGSAFPRCSFVAADMKQACLRSTDLEGGTFDMATMDGADLSACAVTGGSFQGIQARESLWIRTDLTDANMQGADLLGAMMSKARLVRTDLSGSNLSRADVSLVHLDGDTKVDGALMLDTRVDPKREEGQSLG